ncbi:hypothetical protein BH10PSE17_BH10PSE17_15290 [soil metagenome]
MSHGPFGQAASVHRATLVKERVADAIRGAMELLSPPGGSLDAWQMHHLTMAATYGRLCMFEVAMQYVEKAAQPHRVRDAGENATIRWSAARIAGLRIELDRLDQAIVKAR